MANLGTRLTVDGRGVVLEAHIFDWIGEAYDRCVDVNFVAKMRDGCAGVESTKRPGRTNMSRIRSQGGSGGNGDSE